MNDIELAVNAARIREGIITQVHSAASGHPGGALSAADLMAFLYFEKMHIDPKNPQDPGRDRFVLSKGHTCPGLYAALALRGFFPEEELSGFRKLGSMLQGHPCMNETPGVDMSTGSLGQGLSAACGMALNAKLTGADYRVYALLGDGELEEGQIWEAAMFAGAKGLSNLTVIVDNNKLQIDGPVSEVLSVYPIDEKFRAFNFDVFCCNGHDFESLRSAFALAGKTGRPSAVIMDTVKGKGVSFMENKCGWHGKAPNDEEYSLAMAELEKTIASLEAKEDIA